MGSWSSSQSRNSVVARFPSIAPIYRFWIAGRDLRSLILLHSSYSKYTRSTLLLLFTRNCKLQTIAFSDWKNTHSSYYLNNVYNKAHLRCHFYPIHPSQLRETQIVGWQMRDCQALVSATKECRANNKLCSSVRSSFCLNIYFHGGGLWGSRWKTIVCERHFYRGSPPTLPTQFFR